MLRKGANSDIRTGPGFAGRKEVKLGVGDLRAFLVFFGFSGPPFHTFNFLRVQRRGGDSLIARGS